jgi:hypothetical protein
MWQVNGTEVPASWLSFEPTRVLYEFDGPKIFTCRDATGQLYLAYQCDEDREALRFLVVPFSEDLERRLTAGAIDVRDALSRPQAWLFDLGNDGSPLRCWQVDVEGLPPDVLPKPGVLLWADLPPIISSPTPGPGGPACGKQAS